jgi:hypothetical protein
MRSEVAVIFVLLFLQFCTVVYLRVWHVGKKTQFLAWPINQLLLLDFSLYNFSNVLIFSVLTLVLGVRKTILILLPHAHFS